MGIYGQQPSPSGPQPPPSGPQPQPPAPPQPSYYPQPAHPAHGQVSVPPYSQPPVQASAPPYGQASAPPYGQPYGQVAAPPPPKEKKSGGINNGTKIAIAVFVAVVIAAIVQGATVQQIGFGPLSVSFGKTDANTAGGGTNTGNTGNTNPGSGTNGAGNTGNNGSGNTGSTGASADATVSGNWSGSHGDLTLTVTQVDVTSGELKVHVSAQNSGSDSIALPLYGNCTALDDKGTTYQADAFGSNWATNVPGNGTLTGTITFTQHVTSGASSFSLSFANIFVLGGGSITVDGIPVPHA